jgi:hypothetical protein
MLRESTIRSGRSHSLPARTADSYVADIAAERVATTISVAPASAAHSYAWRNRIGEGRDVVTGCQSARASATRRAWTSSVSSKGWPATMTWTGTMPTPYSAAQPAGR